MGSCEVTQGEYELFLEKYHLLADKGAPMIPKDKMADAVTYPTPMYELEAGPVLQRMGRGGKFPAVIMSQYAARQYTKWLSKKTGRFYRLPTEAEWEYACRAGTETAYCFGDEEREPGRFGLRLLGADVLGEYAWYQGNARGTTHTVGLKRPNAWGLFDMHGNVWEWCQDWYDATYYEASPAADPPGPPAGLRHVLRGGSWANKARQCRSAQRPWLPPRYPDRNGFRLALEADDLWGRDT